MKNDILIDDQRKKSLTMTNPVWMGFTVVWGFGNVVNNYANQGLAVITGWILIMALHFIPYPLMVGELGSIFKEGQSGFSYWVKQTMGSLLAYSSDWAYWIVHIPYLAQKPQNLMVTDLWAISRDPKMVKSLSPIVLQTLVLMALLLLVLLTANGIKSIKILGSVASTASSMTDILFILLVLAAPALGGVEVASPNMTSIKTYPSNFNLHYLTAIPMLVSAVGGYEKVSPYVNDTQDAGKNFSKVMIIMALMITVSVILDSVTMGMMFDTTNVVNDLKMNDVYHTFEKLGQYYEIGPSLVIIYTLTNFAGRAAALAMSIGAPPESLLSGADVKYVPNFLRKTNDKETSVGGYKLTTILVSIPVIIPALGTGDSNKLYNWLLDLNSIVMPMHYMRVFVAYFTLKHYLDEEQGVEYKFAKSKPFGKIISGWCFTFTAFACILDIILKEGEPFTSQRNFKLIPNILTPVVLLGLGLILPSVAREEQAKSS